jgi:hypothetical protein
VRILKFPVSNSVLLLLALSGLAAADLPKKAPISRYTSLWTNSPFTSKPPPPEAGPANNPLDDYALIGVSPISDKDGYRVTLINKKKPDERITVDSNKSASGFKILGVTRKPGDPLGTVVRMSSGSMTGTVSFDQKLLTIAAAKAPPQAAPPQVPGQPAAQAAPAGQVPARQPRPRVVPPPAPQAGAPTQSGQPVQPVPQSGNQRPARRGN